MFCIGQKIETRCRRALESSPAALLAATAISTLVLLAASAATASAASSQPRINPPPSADLFYTITAKQSGISVKGDALLRWSTSGNKYVVTTETNAMMFGKILENRSEGSIESTGLAPIRFTERRYRKKEAVTSFNRADKTITYSESPQSSPLKGNEQDHTSIVWQLVSVARTAPGKFIPGSEWIYPVTGRRDSELWTFKVIQTETIQTPHGEIKAVHLQKTSPKHRDQELDIWLAPSLEWYPVQLRMSERDGALIEQKLQKVTPTM